MTTKTAVITGITGFVGQHLFSELIKRGYRVIGLVQDLPENHSRSFPFEVRFIDLARPGTLAGCCRGGDVVFHLAAIPREQRNFTRDDYETINVRGTRELLAEAQKAGVRRFVNVSTLEAAGPARDGTPLTENDEPGPVNDYGRTKLEAEKLALDLNLESMGVTVVRLPMLYGPGNYLNVPKLFKAVQRPFFPLLGSGDALMEFCFIGNAVHGLILCSEHEKAAGELFFISEGSRRLKDVVQSVADAVGARPVLLHVPVSLAYAMAIVIEILAMIFPFRPFRSPITHKPYVSRKTVFWTTRSVNICSSEKAARLLGFKPVFSLNEGLEKTVEDFRKRGWIR